MSAALASFEAMRPRLLRIAFRMLGTMQDAEDVVQDAYLRWHATDHDAVQSPEALLVKAVVRLSIDKRRRLETERASYHGSWLPEPWLGDGSTEPVQLDELGYAATVLLERLSAEERAAFLLREVFDLDYPLIADALEKSEPACRKLVQRAKERLGNAEIKQTASVHDRRALLHEVIKLTRAESPEQLAALLVPAMKLVSDGGGKIFAARYVLEGAQRNARTLWRFVHKAGDAAVLKLFELRGEPVLLIFFGANLYAASFIDVSAGQIGTMYLLLNPDKLQRLEQMLGR